MLKRPAFLLNPKFWIALIQYCGYMIFLWLPLAVDGVSLILMFFFLVNRIKLPLAYEVEQLVGILNPLMAEAFYYVGGFALIFAMDLLLSGFCNFMRDCFHVGVTAAAKKMVSDRAVTAAIVKGVMAIFLVFGWPFLVLISFPVTGAYGVIFALTYLVSLPLAFRVMYGPIVFKPDSAMGKLQAILNEGSEQEYLLMKEGLRKLMHWIFRRN